MALFIMLASFTVFVIAGAFEFFADRRDVVLVAPVSDFAEASFWTFRRHESMMFRFGFVTDCTDWFIHNFMSVHEMLPNHALQTTAVGRPRCNRSTHIGGV